MTIDPLKIRKEKKAKKPRFTGQDTHKKKRIGDKWKKPRGLQSKMRLEKKGYRRSVEIGWGSPKDAKHLHPSGLEIVLVNSVTDVSSINPKTQGAVISSRVGQKKKLAIVKQCISKNIRVLNIKKSEEYEKSVQEQMDKRKKEKEDYVKKKEETKKTLEKRAKDKEKKEKEQENIDEAITEEEKKIEEKKELDKTLTQSEF